MSGLSIIYAYRNRDHRRIEASLNSIEEQLEVDVEVIFIDYGSNSSYSNPVRKLLASYDFANYYYLPTQKQLWNKSRALNFGIKKAIHEKIFIADVDLYFLSGAIKKLKALSGSDKFFLFSLSYLSEKESKEIYKTGKLSSSKSNYSKVGNLNGMLLTSRDSFFKINGFDEFYHFYGSEDVDVIARLENAGYQSQFTEDVYFLHIWHQGYQKKKSLKLSGEPRLTNALRINQQHYFFNRNQKIVVPSGQLSWGETPLLQDNRQPRIFKIKNIAASVEYYLNEILRTNRGQTIIIEIFVDEFYNSSKYRLKTYLGKQTQNYFSMEFVNDYILKSIIFNLRYHYYEYEISEDHKMIIFKIQL